MEVIAQRIFEPLYVWLDIVFLVLFFGLLVFKKKYVTVIVGLLAGVLYQIVDFGIFHLLTHSRTISDGYSMFWVLFWMSMSYGFTNFTWIWLWISKDENLFEWSSMILLWWICCPLLVKTFGSHTAFITIQRTTGTYHGWMAAILFIGYMGLFIWNLSRKKKSERINIPWLLAIGILVQAGWEVCLYLGGIRSAGLETVQQKIAPMIINSLLETNLGMPYNFAIFIAVTKKYTESLKRREKEISFVERIEEYNEKVAPINQSNHHQRLKHAKL